GGVLEQVRKGGLSGRLLEVQRQAPLVAVEREVEEAVGVGAVLEHVAGWIALARLLHLDHVSAQPREHLAARRTRLIVGEIDDPDTGQRLAHSMISVAWTRSEFGIVSPSAFAVF